jgi:hypothetical protein
MCDAVIVRLQIIGNQPAMTLPPEHLGAHDGDPSRLRVAYEYLDRAFRHAVLRELARGRRRPPSAS